MKLNWDVSLSLHLRRWHHSGLLMLCPAPSFLCVSSNIPPLFLQFSSSTSLVVGTREKLEKN